MLSKRSSRTSTLLCWLKAGVARLLNCLLLSNSNDFTLSGTTRFFLVFAQSLPGLTSNPSLNTGSAITLSIESSLDIPLLSRLWFVSWSLRSKLLVFGDTFRHSGGSSTRRLIVSSIRQRKEEEAEQIACCLYCLSLCSL